MKRYETVVIGAGQCGLAMSRCLTQRSVDHIVLERGEIGNSWRTERWDSLRLLTPNWQSQLPGDQHISVDRHGFMTAGDLVQRFDRYARHQQLPVQTGTEVLAVYPTCCGYRIMTNQGDFEASNLVLASGACNIARVPKAAAAVRRNIVMSTPLHYKRPDDLPSGGVLVVGASASGVQIARELQASGRPVMLSIGNHVRVPRIYREWDIKWWMNALGLFDLRFDAVDDLSRVRRAPSLQLIGDPNKSTLDLNSLQSAGVEMVGRFAGIRDDHMQFSGGLANACTMADLKMNRLLDMIDAWVIDNGLEHGIAPAHRFEPTRAPANPRLELDLAQGQIRTIIWATGYRPDYSWLHVPVLDAKGQLRHHGGCVDAPGLYAMGLPFMRRRKSTLIDGAGCDAQELADIMTSRGARMAA